MVVSLCTGPGEWKELQAVMLELDEGESTADSITFSAPQDSITIKYTHWEEYKVTAWVQLLLITPKIGYIKPARDM